MQERRVDSTEIANRSNFSKHGTAKVPERSFNDKTVFKFYV
jgi:hypothetical protein